MLYPCSGLFIRIMRPPAAARSVESNGFGLRTGAVTGAVANPLVLLAHRDAHSAHAPDEISKTPFPVPVKLRQV